MPVLHRSGHAIEPSKRNADPQQLLADYSREKDSLTKSLGLEADKAHPPSPSTKKQQNRRVRLNDLNTRLIPDVVGRLTR